MNKKYSRLMAAVGVEQFEADNEGRIVLTAEQLQQTENRLKQLEDETERLNHENSQLRNEDGDDTGRIEDRTDGDENGDEQALTGARQAYDLISSLI